MTARVGPVLAAIACLAAGCDSRPRAPVIANESLYQNDSAGFRMQAPTGWIVHAKTNLPTGIPVPQEKMLIGYKRMGAAASFEVSCVDLADGADLAEQLTGKRKGPNAWRAVRQPEDVPMAGVKATRFSFEQGSGANANYKESVAVRRGGRVYFFTLVSAPGDITARDEARRTIGTVIWKSG